MKKLRRIPVDTLVTCYELQRLAGMSRDAVFAELSEEFGSVWTDALALRLKSLVPELTALGID